MSFGSENSGQPTYSGGLRAVFAYQPTGNQATVDVGFSLNVTEFYGAIMDETLSDDLAQQFLDHMASFPGFTGVGEASYQFSAQKKWDVNQAITPTPPSP